MGMGLGDGARGWGWGMGMGMGLGLDPDMAVTQSKHGVHTAHSAHAYPMLPTYGLKLPTLPMLSSHVPVGSQCPACPVLTLTLTLILRWRQLYRWYRWAVLRGVGGWAGLRGVGEWAG